MAKSECSSGSYPHNGLCCKFCPKGKYVASDCSNSSDTKCETCHHDTFMEHDNYLHKCLQCKICDPNSHQRVLRSCTAVTDTQCECIEGYYSNAAGHCVKVQHCAPGQGVYIKPNSNMDTQCIDCPAGTFNNISDYNSPCRNHTRCADLNRYLVSPGTKVADAVCGDFITSGCHWMLPAGLWAGLILTLVIVFIVILLRSKCRRRKRRTVVVSVTSQIETPAISPPDLIKHPKSPELLTSDHNGDLHVEAHFGHWDTDGSESHPLWGQFGNLSVPETCPTFSTDPGMFKSEPEEDEWTGV